MVWGLSLIMRQRHLLCLLAKNLFLTSSANIHRALDMALQFPHVEVVGLDLVPPATVMEASIPPNCRFEVDDANLPMEHYDNCFNVVHVRSADQGINDFESFLYEIARTLRPSGVLLLVTGYPVKTNANGSL